MLFAVFHLFNVHQKNPTEQLRFQIILGLYKEFRFNILAAHFIKAYNLLPSDPWLLSQDVKPDRNMRAKIVQNLVKFHNCTETTFTQNLERTIKFNLHISQSFD